MNKYLRTLNRLFWGIVALAVVWAVVYYAAIGIICKLTH